MRSLTLVLLATGASACSTSAVNFEHRSNLEVNTRGVALATSGDSSVAGMFGTTCHIAVADASVGEDYNFPTENEMVRDNSTIHGDPAVLVVSDFGAHVTYPENTWDWSTDDYTTPGVADGQIFEDGVVLLVDDPTDGCRVDWNSGSDVVSTAVPGAFCSNTAITVDRRSGDTYLANGDEIIAVTEDGFTVIGVGADLVVWDRDAQVLYAGLYGDTSFRGLESDGGVRFDLQLEGTITSFDAMGPLAQAAVMVERPGGSGALITVDGFTGEITSTLSTPSAADTVETSENGQSMALVLPREVHFFSVKSFEP